MEAKSINDFDISLPSWKRRKLGGGDSVKNVDSGIVDLLRLPVNVKVGAWEEAKMILQGVVCEKHCSKSSLKLNLHTSIGNVTSLSACSLC